MSLVYIGQFHTYWKSVEHFWLAFSHLSLWDKICTGLSVSPAIWLFTRWPTVRNKGTGVISTSPPLVSEPKNANISPKPSVPAYFPWHLSGLTHVTWSFLTPGAVRKQVCSRKEWGCHKNVSPLLNGTLGILQTEQWQGSVRGNNSWRGNRQVSAISLQNNCDDKMP